MIINDDFDKQFLLLAQMILVLSVTLKSSLKVSRVSFQDVFGTRLPINLLSKNQWR